MVLNIKNYDLIVDDTKDQGDFELIPEDTHTAVCVGIYDIGTHTTPFFVDKNGNPLKQTQIVLEFEIEDGRLISSFYTRSVNQKANFRKHLQTWLGRSIKQGEVIKDLLHNLLGEVANIQVIQKFKKDGTETRKIEMVSKLFKDQKVHTPKRALIYFSFEIDKEIPAGTPDFIKQLIETSDEYPLWLEMVKKGEI